MNGDPKQWIRQAPIGDEPERPAVWLAIAVAVALLALAGIVVWGRA